MRTAAISCLILSVSLLQAQSLPRTQLEESNYNQLTSYNSLMSFLETLESTSGAVSLIDIGRSAKGKTLTAVRFNASDKSGEVLKILIYAQQHGTEPAGKEAALLLARELACGKSDLLKHMEIILVPQLNPDGAENGERKNAGGVDLNMDHACLTAPETQSLRALFLTELPHVTVDVHEFNAVRKSWIKKGRLPAAEIMLDGVTNPNISPIIRSITYDKILPQVERALAPKNISFHRLVVNIPRRKSRFRHSSATIRDARNSMGIYNTYSFILEGRRYPDVYENIRERVSNQLAAMKALLYAISARAQEIVRSCDQSRRDLISDFPAENDSITVSSEYFHTPHGRHLKFPVFDLYKWSLRHVKFKNYYPQIQALKKLKETAGFIFSNDQEELTELLKKHRIQLKFLKEDREIAVEAYTIFRKKRVVREDRNRIQVITRKRQFTRLFSAGDVLIDVRQKARNLIPLLLEPESDWGVVSRANHCSKNYSGFVGIEQEYPVYRLSPGSDIISTGAE